MISKKKEKNRRGGEEEEKERDVYFDIDVDFQTFSSYMNGPAQ